MKLEQLLSELKSRDIQLWVENGTLKYRTPKGALSEDLKDLIITNKNEIIDILKNKKDVEEHPLSFNQQSLWFLHSMYPESAAYNVAVAFRVLSEINHSVLQYAFDQLINEHETLRTTYHIPEGGSGAVQKIHPFMQLPIEYIDASGLDGKELESKVEDYYSKPFDLETGPVIRFNIFKIKSSEYIFLFVIHHIACDAFSLKILLSSFSKHYNDFLKNENTILLKKHTYTSFVDSQIKLIYDKSLHDKYLSFWHDELSGRPRVITLPIDFDHPSVMQFNGSSYFFNISGSEYSRCISLSHDLHVSVNSLLLALFEILLFSITSQDDVVFGIVSSGRLKEEYLDLCGYFINPLVKRAVKQPELSCKEYICQVHDKMLNLLEYQEYPFSLLVEELEKERDSSRTPIFQVLFNYMNKQSLGIITDLLSPLPDNNPFIWNGLSVLPYPIHQQEGQFEMTFEIIDTGKFLFCNLKYNTDLFVQETIAKISSCFLDLLNHVVENPIIPLAELIKSNPNLPSKGIPQLKEKELKKQEALHNLIVAANFTVESVAPSIQFWLEKLFLNYQIGFAPYNQVFQELLDTNSQFHKNVSGINVICLRLEEWLPKSDNRILMTEQGIDKIKGLHQDFIRAITEYNKLNPITTFLLFTPYSPGIISNYEALDFFNNLEKELSEELSGINALYVFNSNTINALYPVTDYYEELGETIGHIPFTSSYFSALGTFISRKLYIMHHKPYKVIVLDCDNTLWNGVVGEEGVKGIKIDEDKKDFQNFLIAQHDSGMVLCLCSKNNSEDVFNVFEQHPDMVLKKEHITASRINWSLKSENILELAKELNLGLDSFIFIDDNPIECSEVESRCPGVLVIRQPEKNISHYFNHLWIFDKLKITRDDLTRADFYRSDIKRTQLYKETYSFKDFIEKLKIKIEMHELKEDEISRASQMTQRVNQFNLKTIRRDESSIIKLKQQNSAHSYSVYVRDRFADYGLVGLFIFLKEKNSIIVDTFLLSCRALGKGVEHAMLASIGRFAVDHNIETIQIEYIPTERNIPIANFLEQNLNAFGKKSGDNTVYSIPAKIISDISFNPEENDAKVEIAEEKQKASNKNLKMADLSQIINIAQNFSDIQNIEDEITAWEKRNKSGVRAIKTIPSEINVSELEQKLHSLWKDILHHEDFTIYDNFFEIGGKSILIPSIVIRLKKEYNINITIIDIFKYPTIRSLAESMGGGIMLAKEEAVGKDTNKQKEAIKIQKMRIQKARGKNRQE